jgi:hypothetical protein
MVYHGVVLFVPKIQVYFGSRISGKESAISNTITCCSLPSLLFQAHPTYASLVESRAS